MAIQYFDNFATKSIVVSFPCPTCQTQLKSDEIGVPTPNYAGDNHEESIRENEGFVHCDNCGSDYTLYIQSALGDGLVMINEVKEDHLIEIVETIEDDWIQYYGTSEHYQFEFTKELKNLRTLNNQNLGNGEVQELLQRQLYSGAITCLEDYLSTTLISNVLENKTYFKKFIKTNLDIKTRTFSLSEIYEELEKVEKYVKDALTSIMYHNLPKVKEIYKATFGVDFPPIGNLSRAVNKRHHMVHRSGKDVEGNKVEITKEIVEGLINQVEVFVSYIDEDLQKLQQSL